MAICRFYKTGLINAYIVGYTDVETFNINKVADVVLDILYTSSKYHIDYATEVFLVNCEVKDLTNISLNIDRVYNINEEQDTYMTSKLSIDYLTKSYKEILEDITDVITEEMGVAFAYLTHQKYDLNMYAKQYIIGSDINNECVDINSASFKFDRKANMVYGYHVTNLHDIDKIAHINEIVRTILEKSGGWINLDTLIYMGIYYLNDNSYKSDISLLKIINKDGGWSFKSLKGDNYKLPYVILNKEVGFVDCNRIKFNDEVYYKDYSDERL